MNIIRTGKITIKDSNVGEPFTYQLGGCRFINESLVGTNGNIGFYAKVNNDNIFIEEVAKQMQDNLPTLTTVLLDTGRDWTHEEVVTIEKV